MANLTIQFAISIGVIYNINLTMINYKHIVTVMVPFHPVRLMTDIRPHTLNSITRKKRNKVHE